jgi:hypothetical protein
MPGNLCVADTSATTSSSAKSHMLGRIPGPGGSVVCSRLRARAQCPNTLLQLRDGRRIDGNETRVDVIIARIAV